MNSITTIAKALIVGGALTIAGLGFAGAAAAAPGGGSNAQDTITRLTDQGYSVQINRNAGWSDAPLDRCIVDGIHGLYPDVKQGQPIPADRPATTAYVDVSCSTND